MCGSVLARNTYNSYKTVNTFSFNDIIAFSIKADGSLDWNTIMRKKQQSEDDNGFNSSFAFMNEKDRVHARRERLLA